MNEGEYANFSDSPQNFLVTIAPSIELLRNECRTKNRRYCVTVGQVYFEITGFVKKSNGNNITTLCSQRVAK